LPNRPDPGIHLSMRLAITTTLAASRQLRAEARVLAERHGLVCYHRGERPLAAVAGESGVDGLVVLGTGRVALFFEGQEHPYHPGMGALRAKRLGIGETSTGEPFLEAAGLQPGDEVLDCTMGLGADALVSAEAVGAGGRVLGLEVVPALALWVSEGLRRLSLPAARRIEVGCAEHGAFLRSLPSRSFDVVTFDPMFRQARAQAPIFETIRRLGDSRPLDPAALEQARRVARRWVVVKDGAPGWDLARLGLNPLPCKRGARRFFARVDAL
jgi:16S rRNA (guanine1516-N2)-methyltransferase